MNKQIHLKPITLSQLAKRVSEAVYNGVESGIWIVAEISEIKVHSTGHCYLSLVERKEGSNLSVADIRATIWARKFIDIDSKFRGATEGGMKVGMKLMFKGNVEFHAIYGLSVNIVDVDLSYTVGEGEMIRRQTIQRLESEGVMNLQNEQNELPIIAQKFAVVSSSQAAGYEDFYKQLMASCFQFELELYEASMQGENTTKSVIAALDKIMQSNKEYDAVIIIRGGGAASDLRWFDDYELCFAVAQFPIPILTGIGHEKDTSVADLVAYHSFKTPTAVAAGIIQRVEIIERKITNLKDQVLGLAQQMLMGEGHRVVNIAHNLRANTVEVLNKNSAVLQKLNSQVPMLCEKVLVMQNNKIEQLQIKLKQEAWFGLQSAQNKINGVALILRNRTMERVQSEIKRVERIKAVLMPVFSNCVERQKQRIKILNEGSVQGAKRIIDASKAKLEYLELTFCRTAGAMIDREKAKVNMLKEKVGGNDPRRILKLGYSIAMDNNGKVIKSGKELKIGESIKVEFADSITTTVVKDIKEKIN